MACENLYLEGINMTFSVVQIRDGWRSYWIKVLFSLIKSSSRFVTGTPRRGHFYLITFQPKSHFCLLGLGGISIKSGSQTSKASCNKHRCYSHGNVAIHWMIHHSAGGECTGTHRAACAYYLRDYTSLTGLQWGDATGTIKRPNIFT